MALGNEKTVSTYDFSEDAMGLGDFITNKFKEYEDAVVVYVRDGDSGAHAKRADWVEETLSDGSKVYNFHIYFEAP